MQKQNKYAYIKILFLTGLISLGTLLGCGTSGHGGSGKETGGNNADSIINQVIVSKPKKQLPDITSDHACRTDMIKLEEAERKAFQDYLDAHPVIYGFEEDYALPERIAEYEKVKVDYHHRDALSEITADKLYQVVKANNPEYLDALEVKIHKEADDKDIKEICELIEEVVNQFLREGHGLDEDRVKCTLSNLKIVRDDVSMNFAAVSPNTVMAITPGRLENGLSITKEYSKKQTLVHEVMHILQLECPCVYEDNEQLSGDFGPFRQNKDVEVNPLYESWILEASAEKNASEYLHMEPYTYTSMVYYLDSLTLLQLVKEDFSVQDTLDLTFRREINELYEYFGATTQQEQQEILKMLYNIQIMQDCPKGFQEIYLKKIGLEKMTDEEQDHLRLLVKGEACQSFSRFFYRNMVQTLEKKGMPLCDLFYLIKIYEMDLNYHVGYNEPNKLSYNQELIDNYLELRNVVFERVAKHLGVELEEINKEFEAYADMWVNEAGEKQQNYDLSWMPQEKKDFIQYMIEEHGNFGYASVSILVGE